MSTDRSRPMIHRVSEFLIPSSKSKLGRTQNIPRSTFHPDHHVGLGILAALERSNNHVTRPFNPTPVHNHNVIEMKKKIKKSIFSLSPYQVFEGFPGDDFLSHCNLCKKKLSGNDIFMYRGEKAFCSEDCRDVQMMKDEKNTEGFRSHGSVSRSAEVGSIRDDDIMLSAGIFAI